MIALSIRKRGFTLIELVMVITILGILAVIAIPRFVNLRADAKNAAANGIEAAGEAGAKIWNARYLINPVTAPYTTAYPGSSAYCFDDSANPPSLTGYTATYNSTTGQWTVTPS